MRKVFREDNLENKFQKEGYVHVPFLKTEDVQFLWSEFHRLIVESGGNIKPEDVEADFDDGISYDFTFIDKNLDYKQNVFDVIVSQLEPYYKNMLHDYKPIIANYIRKIPNNGEVPLHQNWAFADEKKCNTVSIWIPLVNSNRENGALEVVPGSHKRFGENRGPMVPWELESIKNDIIENDLVTCDISAGDAIILDDSIVHYSYPNTTSDLRIAIQLILIPKDLPSIHYHLDPQENPNKIEVLEVDRDFYMQFNPWKKPENKKVLQEISYQPFSLSYQEFQSKLYGDRFDRMKKNKMEKLFTNNTTQLSFEQDGYVKLKGISQEAVKILKNFYSTLNLKDELGYGFHISMDNEDKSLVNDAMEKIISVALPELESEFENPQVFVSSFVVKEKNSKGVVPVHLDWSFIESEEANCSATIWIPLVNVDIDNGALGIIKGSHKLSSHQRPSPSPAVPNPLDKHMFSLFPYLDVISMNAGEALVFNNKTFHGSPPNIFDETRLAVGIGVTQASSNLIHYYLKPGSNGKKMLKYKVDKAFFKKYDNATLSRMYNAGEMISDYELIEELDYNQPDFDGDELLDNIKRADNHFNQKLVEKLSKLFGDLASNANQNSKTKNHANVTDSQDPEPIEKITKEIKLPFWKVYTPLNILREIKLRIFKSS